MTIKITPIGNKRTIIQFVPTIHLEQRHPRRWRADAEIVNRRYFKKS